MGASSEYILSGLTGLSPETIRRQLANLRHATEVKVGQRVEWTGRNAIEGTIIEVDTAGGRTGITVAWDDGIGECYVLGPAGLPWSQNVRVL